jgi:hypothetical protein
MSYIHGMWGIAPAVEITYKFPSTVEYGLWMRFHLSGFEMDILPSSLKVVV